MKKNVNKISNEFEKILNEEFQHKVESKAKLQDHSETHDSVSKKENNKLMDSKNEKTVKKNDPIGTGDEKKG